jgi:hypothetical protein
MAAVEHFRGTIGGIFINVINTVVLPDTASGADLQKHAMSKGTCTLLFWNTVR